MRCSYEKIATVAAEMLGSWELVEGGPPARPRGVRGAVGDLLVGVGPILESGARARNYLFIILLA